MPTKHLGLPDTWNDGETLYDAATIRRLHGGVESQVFGIIRVLLNTGYSLIPIPDATSFKVTAGSGLEVNIAPGAAFIEQSQIDGLYVATSESTSLEVPDDAISNVFVVLKLTGDNDSRETQTPYFVASDQETIDGGMLLATVTTSSGDIVNIDDARPDSYSVVNSVNGKTGEVELTTDDIDEGGNNLYYPSADKTKLGNITGTNTGDQTLSLDGVDLSISGDNGNSVTLPGITAITPTAPITATGTTTKTIGITAATTSAAGSMSASDKTKLDGVATGATANSTDADLLNRANHTGTQDISTVTDLQTTLDDKADLVAGKVPAVQLPSYVDDVLMYADLASFPGTGEDGKLYVTEDTNLTYRWTGSTYTLVGGGGGGGDLALGETSSTAYRGDRGKIAYDHSQLTTGNPHNVTLGDLSITATATELNYVDGVTSAIQTQLDSKAADSDVVKLTGAQTVAGVKTFSDSPIVPAPTTDMQAATKKYVDDNSGGSASVDLEAAESLTTSEIVYVDGDGKAALASAATSGMAAVGYVDSNYAALDTAKVLLGGTITGLSGLTPGGAIYLDTTAGGITQTAPDGIGNIVQQIGIAVSATAAIFITQPPLEL